MPELPGVQLAGELARLRPGLPVVVCSSLHELSESVRGILG